MEALPNFLTILVFVVTAVGLVHSTIVMSKVPQSITWAGLRKEVLSKTRACIREVTAGLRTLNLGYSKVARPFSINLAPLTLL